MLVVGIDPGTATTGYAFVRQNALGGLEAVSYGVITTPPDLTLEKRLQQLFEQLKQLILLHNPDSGAVEKLFFQRNVSTALSVGHARGVVLLALAQVGVVVKEYTPMEVKQAVSGYGGADKNQVQQMVKAILELDSIPEPDDAADALAVAICHINSSRFSDLVDQSESA